MVSNKKVEENKKKSLKFNLTYREEVYINISIAGGRGRLRQVASARETGPEEPAGPGGDDEVRPGRQSGLHLSPLHLQQ